MAYKEKRHEKRFNVDMTCTISGHEDHKMTVLDISKSGIALWGDVVLTETGAIDIEVDIGGAKVSLRAMVANVVKLDGKIRYGMEIIHYPEQWLDLIYCHMLKAM